jgi:predicted amidohydrolase
MRPSLHVGAAQVVARVEDLDGNLALIEQFAGEARRAGVQVLLFSEGVLQGGSVSPEAVRRAVPADGAAAQRLAALARGSGMLLLVGFNERAGDQIFNSYFLAYPDGRLQVQRKIALNDLERKVGFTAGPAERLPLDIPGWCARMVICADWGHAGVLSELERTRCDLVFLGTAGGGTRATMLPVESLDTPEGVQRFAERVARVGIPVDLMADCRRKGRALVACNCVGDNGHDLCQEGNSFIVDRDGCLAGLIPGAPVAAFQRSRLVHAVLGGDAQPA